jgi:O-antigen biosynthesis protein
MKRFPHITRKALRYWQTHGTRSLLTRAYQKLKSGTAASLLSKVELLEHYDFVLHRPVGSPALARDVPKNTINWYIPPFGFGSGGHLNIFRFIQKLERDGFECRIVIVGAPRPSSSAVARKQICDWFFQLDAQVFLNEADVPPANITVATSWQTAYLVRNFRATNHHCYFVQDFEPYFYAVGSEYAWAEATYRFGFRGITAGGWLEKKLAQDYGMLTSSVGFSYDQDLYRPLPRRIKEQRRAFFYARPPTQRRAFEMGVLVLAEVVRRLPDVEIVFAGWDVSNYAIPFSHINSGVVRICDLPDLYSQCDVALVLSFTNLSLLPLELMACGTPVVSNRAPCTEWLLNDQNAELSEATVEDLSNALCNVLNDPIRHAALRESGFKTIAATDWEREARKMADVFRALDEVPTCE